MASAIAIDIDVTNLIFERIKLTFFKIKISAVSSIPNDNFLSTGSFLLEVLNIFCT